MKKIGILGSTGSIGTQALDLIYNNDQFKVLYLSAHSNFKLLAEQAIKFNVETICISDSKFHFFPKKKKERKRILSLLYL